MISSVQEVLSSFATVPLEAMESVELLERFDTKFTFHQDQLAGVLEMLPSEYNLLSVGGIREQRYETLYFDTAQMNLFDRHHRGIGKRQKVRFRTYLDSGLCFFEVKARSNKGRTLKKRTRAAAIESPIRGEAESLLRKETSFTSAELDPVLWVYFTRLTFKSTLSHERLTFDLDLSYRTKNGEVRFPNLIVAEVKKDRPFSSSPLVAAMRFLRIRPGEISKYCFGVASLYPRLKMNLFKARVRQIMAIVR